MEFPSDLTALTAQIVTAYVKGNQLEATELPNLISTVREVISNLGKGPVIQEFKKDPAVPIRKSVTPDFIYCLECGTKHRMLKRHIKAEHEMTVQQYKARWKLPDIYPITAPNYSKQRSELAKKAGLGKDRGGVRSRRRRAA